MSNIDYKQYIITPGAYGYVDVQPLLIANIINTRLEEWFQNYKFLQYSISQVKPDDYSNHKLNLEFSYPLRLRERTFGDIVEDVSVQIDLTQYQKLTNILHESIELCYECFQILTSKKIGKSIKDLESAVLQDSVEFNKLSFPDKLRKLTFLTDPKPISEFALKINSLRNCLEHRNGVISEHDLKGKKRLCILWKYPKIRVDNGAEIKVGAPFTTQPMGQHDISIEKRCFSAGQKIQFSFHDNYKCIFTLIFILQPIISDIFKAVQISDQELTIRRVPQ